MLRRTTDFICGSKWTRGAASVGRRANKDPTRGMVISGGTTEPTRRRGPGSTKMVRVTNKAGRVFEISIPISKLTHPQKKLLSPVGTGEWVQLDTSFVDVGDFDDDVPTALGESLQQGTATDAISMANELRSLCVDYVSMDTEGMVNHPQKNEQNTGPDYEDDDRKSIRRRMWFTVVHRLNDVRTLVWPDGEMVADSDRGEEVALAHSQYEALRSVAAASTFAINKAAPYEDRPLDDYQSPNIEREVRVTCRSIARSGPMNFFVHGEVGLQCLTTMSALCRDWKIPFSECVAGNQQSTDHSSLDVLEVVEKMRNPTNLREVDQIPQKIAAGLLAALSHLPMRTIDADQEKRIRCLAALDFLFGCCTRVGKQDSLAPFDGDDLISLLNTMVRVVRDNQDLFHVTPSESNVSSMVGAPFVKTFAFHLHAVLDRCRALLYHRAGGSKVVAVETEDGYLPIVALQQNAEKRHPGLVVHSKIGMSASQGYREVHLELRHTARILKCIQDLQECGLALEGPDRTLQHDLVQHLSGCLTNSATHKLHTLDDIVRALEAIAHTGQLRHDAWEANRVLSAVDQRVGGLLHELQSITTLARLVDGFARCGCVPSSLNRIYAVALRLLSMEKVRPIGAPVTDVVRLCDAAARLSCGTTPLERRIALPPIQAASTACMPATVAAAAATLFGADAPCDLATVLMFARAMFASGHPSIGAAVVLRNVQQMHNGAVVDASSMLLLLIAAHRQLAEDIAARSDSELRELHTAIKALSESARAPSSTPLNAEAFLQHVAMRHYIRHNVDATILFPPLLASGTTGLLQDDLCKMSVRDLALLFTQADGDLIGGAPSETKGIIGSALLALLAEAKASLLKAQEPRRPAAFSLNDLDHVIPLPSSYLHWPDLRWACLEVLRCTPNVSKGDVETVAHVSASILGVYMHNVMKAMEGTTSGTVDVVSRGSGDGFELAHVRRMATVAEFEGDLRECGAALETAGYFGVAEAQFAAVETCAHE